MFTHGTSDPFGSILELRDAAALIPAAVEIVEVTGARHDLGSKVLNVPEVAVAAALRICLSSQVGYRRFMTEQQYDAIIVGGRLRRHRHGDPAQAPGFRELVLLERLADLAVPGTSTTTQGLACDVPTTYSCFFEPNPNWSRLFCTGAEIKQYADDVADKYDIRRHIRFNTAVEAPAGTKRHSFGG